MHYDTLFRYRKSILSQENPKVGTLPYYPYRITSNKNFQYIYNLPNLIFKNIQVINKNVINLEADSYLCELISSPELL
jgi:hypothetical protein